MAITIQNGGKMNHLPELLKIIEAGLRGNSNIVHKYGELVIKNLEAEGDNRSADLIKKRLVSAPSLSAFQQLSKSMSGPKDQESRLDLFDKYTPQKKLPLILQDETLAEINNYIHQIENQGKLIKAGIPPETRFLIHGPPGCGKNRIAEYVAGTLGLELIIVRCDALISSFLGSTSKNIRAVFEYAESNPCVLFLDELDAVGKARSDSREVGELQRVVISLLQNIDYSDRSLILIGATNHPELLDPALWRRFPLTISIKKPGLDERIKMYKAFSRGYAKDSNMEKVAELAEGMTGDEIRLACEESIRRAVLQDQDNIDIGFLTRRTIETRIKESLNESVAGQEIANWVLREKGDGFLSKRKLAEISGISVRQVSKVARGITTEGVR